MFRHLFLGLGLAVFTHGAFAASQGRPDPLMERGGWRYAEPSVRKDQEGTPARPAVSAWRHVAPYVAYLGDAETEWDMAMVCRPQRQAVEFEFLTDERPDYASAPVSLGPVREIASVRHDPNGMGTLYVSLPARGAVVRRLASARDVLRLHWPDGPPGEIRVTRIMQQVASACLRSNAGEIFTAPHDPPADVQ